MARIAGVDLPREKRVEIGLTYIYGIGRVSANRILEAAGVDPNTRVRDLTDEEVKNTMTRIAATEAGMEDLVSHLEGTTALAVSAEDAVAPAKVISEFMKKNNLEDQGILTIKAGIVEGQVVTADEVKAIASLPSREVLLGKLLGSIQAPLSNTVGVMGSMLRSIVTVLDAVRKQKEEQASA